MRTIFYLNGKQVTRRELNDYLGRAAVRELVFLAKEKLFMESQEQSDFTLGSMGAVSIITERKDKHGNTNRQKSSL